MDKFNLARTSTDITLLEKSSDDKSWRVREHVASNPNTPVHILEKLSDDKNWLVRNAVLNNTITPLELKTFMILKY